MPKNSKYAILSFSGGLDSTSLLINLIYNNFKVLCITFDYGQNHLVEIEKSKKNISYLKSCGIDNIASHKIINIKDAFNNKIKFYDHVTHIIVHSLLHISGYKHKNNYDSLIMQRKEIKILNNLRISNPYL